MWADSGPRAIGLTTLLQIHSKIFVCEPAIVTEWCFLLCSKASSFNVERYQNQAEIPYLLEKPRILQ